jgi:glutathione peroxidase-family protein
MKLVCISLVACLIGSLNGVDFYTLEIAKLGDGTKSMEDYRGKKVLVVILPASRTASDSALLRRIDSLSLQYASSLSVLAIPSIEDGYSSGASSELAGFYGSLLNPGVTIATGVHTRKGSVGQHPLLRWLTHEAENTHFDYDVAGAGQKFFINERGELYGVVDVKVELTERVMGRLME